MATARAYIHLASRTIELSANMFTASHTDRVRQKRDEVLGALRHMDVAHNRATQRAPSPKPKQTVAERVMETSPPTEEAVQLAPDDPDESTQEPEDFGEPTSNQDSEPPPEPAPNVGERTYSEAVIGFLPPQASSD
jgi:hypothetical protein